MKSRFVKILIYIRVSDRSQAFRDGVKIDDGSLPVQKRRAEAEIEREYKAKGIAYKVVEVIEDAGISAKDADRPGFQRLWTLIANKEIDVVICSELSRVMRDTLLYLLFKQHCEKYNVTLKFIGSNFNRDDPNGEAMETMVATFATLERKMTSVRVRRNIIDRLEKDGKINGAGDLLGLDCCPKRKGHFVRNETEILSLRRLLNIYIESSSKAEAMRKASELGIADKKGKSFTSFRFDNLIKNVEWRYSARYKFIDKKTKEEKIIALDYNHILDEQLVHEVITKREKFKKFQARCGKRNHIYLLSRVLQSCSGMPLQGHIGHGRYKDYRYYYSPIIKLRLNAEEVEKLIEKKVISYFKDSGHLQKLVSKSMNSQKARIKELNKQIKSLANELDELNRQSGVLVDHMTREGLTDQAIEVLSKRLNDNESKKASIVEDQSEKEELKELLTKKPDISIVERKIADYANKFSKLDRTTKRALIEQIFEKIEVIDKYTLKLHIRKAPIVGAFSNFQTTGCDKELNGGTCKT